MKVKVTMKNDKYYTKYHWGYGVYVLTEKGQKNLETSEDLESFEGEWIKVESFGVNERQKAIRYAKDISTLKNSMSETIIWSNE